MKRVAYLLSACSFATLATAAQVEVFTTARPAPILRAEAVVAPKIVTAFTRTEVSQPKSTAVALSATRLVSVREKVEIPARKAVPASEPARALPVQPSPPVNSSRQFTYQDKSGKVVAAPIVDHYQDRRIVYPTAKGDPRVNPRLARAATIAQERAHAHSKSRCWRYVKNALLASGIISSYPKTAYAKEAGDELVRDYGFKKLPIRDPYKAPIGAVLVYGARRAPGHVEIRTKTGFVSDFLNKKPSPRPLIGIYAKA
ncbi:MAG: hypothetical protein ABI992_05110 [Chthoniobacterales bacterium]